MADTTTPFARQRVLRLYREWRRAGYAPSAAADRVRWHYADTLANWAMQLAGRCSPADIDAYRAARELVLAIDSRRDALPFWQTGKVTPLPDSFTGERCTRCNLTRDEHSAEHITHTFVRWAS